MLNNNVLKNFRNDFNEAMVALEKKYGYKIDLGSINYGFGEATAKITINDVGDGVATGLSPEQVIWEKNCEIYGLKKEDYGKEIRISGRLFRIVGILPNCRKNGVLIEDVNTKTQYKTSYESARMAIDMLPKKNKEMNA